MRLNRSLWLSYQENVRPANGDFDSGGQYITGS